MMSRLETLQRQVESDVGRVVRVQEAVRQGLLLWQEPVLEARQTG